jgi:hypothetical protein
MVLKMIMITIKKTVVMTLSDHSQNKITIYYNVRFQVLTAASMMFRAVFWVRRQL